MSIKSIARRHYQRLVDTAAVGGSALAMPPEGWLRTVRKALGMSGAQLARRMGVTRARIDQAERSEIDGGASLKSMQAMAEAMGCRFVYAIVPPEGVQDLIRAQARTKATKLVRVAGTHMALEDQALPEHRLAEEIDRLADGFAEEMPADLWSDR